MLCQDCATRVSRKSCESQENSRTASLQVGCAPLPTLSLRTPLQGV